MTRVIMTKEGDSLWSLFGEKWVEVYCCELNRAFRIKFKDPTNIWANMAICIPNDFVIPQGTLKDHEIITYCFDQEHLLHKAENVHSFCYIAGNHRSGTTITATVVGLHPKIAMSSEQNIISKVSSIPSYSDLLYSVLEFSMVCRKEYNLASVNVIGDKMPINPKFYTSGNIERLLYLIGNRKLKLIHCIRNPFENICGRIIKGHQTEKPGNLIEWYFKNFDLVESLVNEYEIDRIFVHNEDLIFEPETVLKQICCFLEVPHTDEYISRCKKELFQQPRMHAKTDWADESIREVYKNIENNHILSRYRFMVPCS